MNVITGTMPLAAIDLESIIIGVVIVGSIVSRMVKAKNEIKTQGNSGSAPSSPPASRPKRISSAQAELEDFLQSLNVETQIPEAQPVAAVKPAAPPPPPPPQPPTTRRPAKAKTAKRKAPVAFTNPVSYSAPVDSPSQTIECTREHKLSKLGLALKDDLQDNKAVRKAILLKEILGPPLALRSNSQLTTVL